MLGCLVSPRGKNKRHLKTILAVYPSLITRIDLMKPPNQSGVFFPTMGVLDSLGHFFKTLAGSRSSLKVVFFICFYDVYTVNVSSNG